MPLPPILSIAKRLAPFDLVLTRRVGHLTIASSIWRTPVPPTGWPTPIRPPLGIDRHLAAHLDHAFLDRLPRFAGLGDAEVVNRHVLRSGEAVVGLDSVETSVTPESPARRNASRIACARMRQHVEVVAALGDLLVEFDRRRVMAPAEDAREFLEFRIAPLGVFGGEFFRGQE